MDRPCPRAILCESDGPISNYSSENDDGTVFRHVSITWPKPNIYDPDPPPWNPDGHWTAEACDGAFLCESTVSQEAADDCAEALAEQCVGGPVNPNDPVCLTNPELCVPPVEPAFNDQQVCTFTCPDRSSFVWTIAAGIIRAQNKDTANQLARALACERVSEHWACLSVLAGGACVDQAFSSSISASGPDAPFTFEIVSGSLPLGIFMSQVGPRTAVFAGTCSIPGNYTFTLHVTTSAGAHIYKSYTIGVLGITNDSLPDAEVGVPYSVQLTAAGGSAPYVFEIEDGFLPSGLNMATDGTISGTPDTAEFQDINFRVTEASVLHQSCIKPLSIEVIEACWIDLATPLFVGPGIAATGTGFNIFAAFQVFKNRILTPQIFSGYDYVAPSGGGYGTDGGGLWNYHHFNGIDIPIGPGVLFDQLNMHGQTVGAASDNGSIGMIYVSGGNNQIELWNPDLGTLMTLNSPFVGLDPRCLGPSDHIFYAIWDGGVNFDIWMWHQTTGHVHMIGSTYQNIGTTAASCVASTGHAAFARIAGVAYRRAYFWNGLVYALIYDPGISVNVISCNASDLVAGLVTNTSFFMWNPTDGLTVLGLPPAAATGSFAWSIDSGLVIVNANNGSWYYHNGAWGDLSDLLEPSELWSHVDNLFDLSHDGYACGQGIKNGTPNQQFWCKLCSPP